MIWSLLGIQPTKDKKEITSAYRAQLLHSNPEDDPEKFKQLRSAYEEALKLADKTDEVINHSTVDIWKQQLSDLYNNFPCRINAENWITLLNEDVCVALDTRPLIEEILLRFLMEDYFIPQSVWQTLDHVFHWLERKEELYETYPKDFIDFAVINGICYAENLPSELFTPGLNGKDCDAYRKLYYKANQSSLEDMGSILNQMNHLSESHPYGEVLNNLLLVQNGEIEKGIEGYKMLAKKYPENAKIQLEWAQQCFNMNDLITCEACCRHVLLLRSDFAYAKELLANCLAKQGKYEEAKTLIFGLMDLAGGDQRRIYQLHQLIQDYNNNLILKLEKDVENNPSNDKLRINLAWCYLQNERANDALNMAISIQATYEDAYEYHNLLAKIYYSLEDYSNALNHLQETVDWIQNMVSDGSKEVNDRINSLSDKLQMQGSCLIKLNNKEEALLKYEQALEISPENPEILTNMGRILCFVGNMYRAIDVYEKLIRILPNSYHGFYLLAQTYFDVGKDREAFEAVNRALELEGGDLGVYILKMRILLRNNAYEGVRYMLDFLRQNGVADEINVVWCEAELLNFGENKLEEALDLYRKIAQRVETGEVFNDCACLYYRLLCLEAQHLDANKEEDRKLMLEFANKSLSYDENYYASLDYKAWLLKRGGSRKEALDIYHQLEQVERRSMNVEQELAELYYQDLNHDADKALYYYELLIKHEAKPVYLFYAGTCCRILDLFEKGENYFLQLQEMDPEDIDGYNGMSYLYDKMKRYEESLEQINQVIRIANEWKGNQSKYYYHKAMILRRLNRPLEAIAVIDELTEKYGNDDVFKEKFDVYCQFGMWDEANQILDTWKEAKPKDKCLKASYIDYKLFTGRIDEARSSLFELKNKLNKFDAERLSLLLAELDGDEKVQMRILKKKSKNSNDISHQFMNMAQVQWWNGNYDDARKYAQEALIELDEIISNSTRNLALYRSRRALALAILGRIDEAKAELDVVYNLPLCDGCNYCYCKDADIFKANIEEICGNYDKAMELYQDSIKRWSDDLDFISGIRRLFRRGY
ncbi:MAG: hypothetical protein IJ359_04610 [Erysipelotrichaceae bacterium]|nr:hypothetical protein [Erysipelotrichaceae bacterium]